MYSEKQLSVMPPLDLRKAGRAVGMGAGDFRGLKSAEIVRKILKAQKPGGVDARINPKAAAAAKAAANGTPVAKKRRSAPPSAEQVFDDDDDTGSDDAASDAEGGIEDNANVSSVVEVLKGHTALLASLQNELEELRTRSAAMESALIEKDILDARGLGVVVPRGQSKKVAAEEDEVVDVDELFDEDGALVTLSADDVQAFSADTILEIDARLKEAGQPGIPKVDAAKFKRDPRAARDALMKVLLRLGAVTRDSKRAAREEKQAATPSAAPWPPRKAKQRLEVYDGDDDAWYPAVLTGLEEAPDADTGEMTMFYTCDVDVNGDVFEMEELTDDDIRPLSN